MLTELAGRDQIRHSGCWRVIRGKMADRLHDGARRSRLVDREAARRRRGLDGRGAAVTRIARAANIRECRCCLRWG